MLSQTDGRLNTHAHTRVFHAATFERSVGFSSTKTAIGYSTCIIIIIIIIEMDDGDSNGSGDITKWSAVTALGHTRALQQQAVAVVTASCTPCNRCVAGTLGIIK